MEVNACRLAKLSDAEILSRVRTLSAEERHTTAALIRVIHEVDRRRLYSPLGYSSLFEFLVRELGYSEGSAQRRIGAARLLHEVPEIEAKIRAGDLTLSATSRAQGFFNHEKRETGKTRTPDEKREVISAIAGKSARETDRVLARLSGSPVVLPRDRERPIGADHTAISFTADAELMAKIERVRELLSRKAPVGSGTATLIGAMADFVIKKLDPLSPQSGLSGGTRRARAVESAPDAPSSAQENVLVPTPGVLQITADVGGETADGRRSDTEPQHGHPGVLPIKPARSAQDSVWVAPSPRGYIAVGIRRAVWRRDGGRCTYVSATTQRRCESRQGLELDHVQPVALGGESIIGNITLKCRGHNLQAAVDTLGRKTMDPYLRNP